MPLRIDRGSDQANVGLLPRLAGPVTLASRAVLDAWYDYHRGEV